MSKSLDKKALQCAKQHRFSELRKCIAKGSLIPLSEIMFWVLKEDATEEDKDLLRFSLEKNPSLLKGHTSNAGLRLMLSMVGPNIPSRIIQTCNDCYSIYAEHFKTFRSQMTKEQKQVFFDDIYLSNLSKEKRSEILTMLEEDGFDLNVPIFYDDKKVMDVMESLMGDKIRPTTYRELYVF